MKTNLYIDGQVEPYMEIEGKQRKIIVDKDTGEFIADVTDREDKTIDQLLESLKRDVGELLKRAHFNTFEGSLKYNVEIEDNDNEIKVRIYK